MAYTASQLVGMGFEGYTGWGDTEANANYLATNGSGKGSLKNPAGPSANPTPTIAPASPTGGSPQTDPAGKPAPPGGFQTGGWYSGFQYWNGSFAPQAGQLHPQSSSPNAGQPVSAEVNAQSAKAQGVTPEKFNSYLATQNQTAQNNPSGAPVATGGSPGITGASGGLGLSGGPAPLDLQAVYNGAYNSPDIVAANKSISDLQAQVTARQTALNTALAGINDNPFYSEATRVGKQAQLNTEAQNDMNVLNNQLVTAQNNLVLKQADAQRQVNIATDQYNINRQEYQDSLSRFNMLLSSGAFTYASASDLATISTQTGISTSMLQSIQKQAQQKDVAPQIITSTDNAGNLSIVTVDKNTGAVINQETLGGVGKSKPGTGTGTTAVAQDQFNQTASQTNWIKTPSGQSMGIFPQLVAKYAAALSLPAIYKMYANTDIGKMYGTPTEDPSAITSLYNSSKNGG
jgi:hypothetical protein